MKIELKPSCAADITALLGADRPPYRCRLMTAWHGGRILGIGGLTFMPDGSTWATLVLIEEARRYGVALIRAWRQVLRWAREAQLKTIYAKADERIPQARAFLRRLGFEPMRAGIWVLQLAEGSPWRR